MLSGARACYSSQVCYNSPKYSDTEWRCEVAQPTCGTKISEINELMEPVISEQENSSLCSIPSPEEIKKIVRLMNPLKAPGPDGMPGVFYRHCWSIVGP